MRKRESFRLDRSIIFLVIILLVLIISAIVLVFALQTDPVRDSLEGDKLLKVLMVVEDRGIPITSHILAYYPGSKRAAMFDIPGETGLILPSLGRVDRIEAVYREKGIQAYKKEIEALTGIDVPFYISCSLDQFARIADLLSGFTVFIPTPVDFTADQGHVLLPSGSVSLDGDKLRIFMTYTDMMDQETESAGRRQRGVLSFFRALSDNSGRAFSKGLFPVLQESLDSNVPEGSLRELLTELSRIDAERLVPLRVTGSQREIDGKMMLLPFGDGTLLKEIVRQTLAGLASGDSEVQERIYSIEIMNGTKVQGLARTTSELYQSFGYDVIRVGNSEGGEIEDTVIIDRIGNPAVGKAIGNVIMCENILAPSADAQEAEAYGREAVVDFTIILGKDFNGRFVR